jgi:1,2-phenylacetyl-CoA epoxidase PaaB subunit
MTLKNFLGSIPYTADLYDAIRKGRPRTRYNLEQLAAHLPSAIEQVRPFAEKAPKGKKLLLFATLHYWVEQAAMVGLALRGMGHDVTIAYLPYSDWRVELNPFDLRRQDLYTKRVLAQMDGLVKSISLLGVREAESLPAELKIAVETASAFDTMYTLQVEDFDRDSELYRLRLRMNRSAALTALALLQNQRPDAVLVPNGLVTELGVFYQVARYLDMQTVTYEFNDQREQIWLAQNEIVMRQNTDALWAARGSAPLTESEREEIAALEDARTSAKKYGKGTRFWQDVASMGSEQLRQTLGLDERPVALLATNVLGDSLTLGRNAFASSMAEWITKTVQYFAKREDVQLVVRVHPGERLMKGPSMLGVIERAVPQQPANIRVVGPDEKVNTYDCMEIAGLGLAYTTTVGMEMAMRAVPVVLAGNTHYRGRGFTFDPSSWDEYYATLDHLLSDLPAHRLSREQVETAWNYAYRFFFDFPMPFPWRLMHFWKDVDIWPISRVLSDEGQAEYKETFDYLAGEPIKW